MLVYRRVYLHVITNRDESHFATILTLASPPKNSLQVIEPLTRDGALLLAGDLPNISVPGAKKNQPVRCWKTMTGKNQPKNLPLMGLGCPGLEVVIGSMGLEPEYTNHLEVGDDLFTNQFCCKSHSFVELVFFCMGCI